MKQLLWIIVLFVALSMVSATQYLGFDAEREVGRIADALEDISESLRIIAEK